MLSIEQFINLGLFVKEDFIEPKLLSKIVSEISGGVSKPTLVLNNAVNWFI